MKIQQLENLLDAIQTALPAINYHEMVIDDSQLVKFMQSIKASQNLMLFCLVPDYNGQGTNNAVQTITVVQLLVMKKAIDTRSHKSFLADLKETEAAGFAIKDYLVDQRDINCDLRFFKEANWQMSPIWNLAGSNGYSINFNLPHNDG